MQNAEGGSLHQDPQVIPKETGENVKQENIPSHEFIRKW